MNVFLYILLSFTACASFVRTSPIDAMSSEEVSDKFISSEIIIPPFKANDLLIKNMDNVGIDEDGNFYIKENIFPSTLSIDIVEMWLNYKVFVINFSEEHSNKKNIEMCPPNEEFYNPDYMIDAKYRKYPENTPEFINIHEHWFALKEFIGKMNILNSAVNECYEKNQISSSIVEKVLGIIKF